MKRLGCLILAVLVGGLSAEGYETNTHAAMSLVAGRDHPESKVADVLINLLGYTKGGLETAAVEGRLVASSFWEWLQRGAVEEDSDLVLRYGRHFYNPINKEGLSDGSLFGIPVPGTFVNALDWAWDNTGAFLNADHGWKNTREKYAATLLLFGSSTETEEARRSGLAEVLFDLGHCIHLLQDMGQPQHTRNDAHTPANLGGDNAPYEMYCATNYGTPEQIQQWPYHPIPRFTGTLPSPQDCDGKPPEFVAFWDTHRLSRINRGLYGPRYLVTDPLQLDPNSLGLAEFSHAYFVTDDTLFTGERARQLLYNPRAHRQYSFNFSNKGVPVIHRFDYPRFYPLSSGVIGLVAPYNIPERNVIEVERVGETSPDQEHYAQLLANGTPLTVRGLGLGPCCVAAYEPPPAGTVIGGTLLLGLSDVTRLAHARALIPRAVAYSAGLLNYFFRGRLTVRYLAGVQDAGTGTVEITNDSSDPLGPGSFSIQERTGSGTSFLIEERARTDNSSPVAPGGKIQFAIQNIREGSDFRVIFIGTLGSEKDIGVAVGRYCGIPPIDVTHPYRAIDLGTVDGIFDNDVGNWGLNNQNQILGFHQRLQGVPLPSGGGGFLWWDADENGDFTLAERVFIGTVAGQPASRVMDINDHGVVAGTAYGSDNKIYLARWTPAPNGQYPSTPTLSVQGVGAVAINNADTILDPIAGKLWTADGNVLSLAEQFAIEFDAQVRRFEAAFALDDRGRLLVRIQKLAQGVAQGSTFMIWTLGGGLVDTAVKGGAFASFNNAGQAGLLTFKRRVVNGLELELPNVVVWDEHTGQISDLDTSMSLFNLNDCGQLAGHTTSGTTVTPKLWDVQTGVRNLNSLVSLPNGTSLTHVLRINNGGQLLVAGLTGTQRRIFLLSPP